MPLVSKLFSGDPVFEQCLVEDKAHIPPGSRGPHVAKIQLALATLAHYVVAPGESQSQTYGTSTANGVLTYKRKRGIINPAYQTTADNVVGKMTIASLDADMARAERKPKPLNLQDCFPARIYPSPQRFVVAFALPVSHSHIAAKAAGGAGAGGAAAGAAGGAASAVTAATAATAAVSAGNAGGSVPLTPAMLVDMARLSLPLATTWVQATLNKLSAVRGKIQRLHVYTPDEIKFFEPIQIHFKVNIPAISETDAKDRIDQIIELYQTIQKIFATGTSRMVGDGTNPVKASAPLGGFAAGSKITIGRDFANANANMRAAVLIHEGGHFADASCSHAASELPAPNGTPISDSFGLATNPSQKNYANLNFDLSIRNAYSVAQCAMHNGLGTDQRPP